MNNKGENDHWVCWLSEWSLVTQGKSCVSEGKEQKPDLKQNSETYIQDERNKVVWRELESSLCSCLTDDRGKFNQTD